MTIASHPSNEPTPATDFFRFQIDTTLGAKPQTVQAYGRAKQQRVGLILIWKWNYRIWLPIRSLGAATPPGMDGAGNTLLARRSGTAEEDAQSLLAV